LNSVVFLVEDIKQQIIKECKNHHFVETGGLLFGKVVENSIYILNIYTPEYSRRNLAQFSIDEKEADKITNLMINCGLDYIGNWHKHTTSKKPSQGDDKEVEEFFTNNIHKKILSIYYI